MAGPLPKPTVLKAVTGNPGKRPLNKQEPDPDYLQELAAPAWLAPAAADVWNEIAPKLAKARLLTEVDVELLTAGCVAIAQFRLAVARAGENLVVGKRVTEGEDAPSGGDYINPWLLVQSMAFKQIHKVLSEFGMSPAARTRIAIQPQGDLFAEKNDRVARYFAG